MRAGRQGGFTLIELVIGIVILGIALAGILAPMNLTTARSADPMIQHQAVAIAEAYMEEILLRSFLDPDTNDFCPAKEASRDLFDNVCDYHLLSDAGARNQNNPVVISGLEDYDVTVTVSNSAFGPGGQQVPSTESARIEVNVLYGGMVDFTLVGYRTSY